MMRLVRPTALGLLALLAACATAAANAEVSLTPAQRLLIGEWRDEGGAITTIEERGGQLVVASVVDGDQEVYEIREVGWRGPVFYWVYHVPSTGYTVTEEVLAVRQNELDTRWSNSSDDSGGEIFTRVAR